MKDLLLSNLPLLAPLPPNELDRLANACTQRDFPAGQVILREGETGTSAYLILSGQVQIVKALGTDDERIIGFSGPGDFVGEMSLLSPKAKRTASVRTVAEVHTLELPLVEFDSLLRRFPEVGFQLIRVLSQRLDASNGAAIHDLHEKNVEINASHRELTAAYRRLRRTRGFAVVLLAILLVIVGAVAALLLYYQFGVRTALDEPTDLLVAMAELGRSVNVPADAAAQQNPLAVTSDLVVGARRTYTGRCTHCHGPDGKADTAVGSHIFPPAPDLTSARTQGRTDGALHWIIASGSPRSGMPGWKETLSDEEIWQLVAYVRLLTEGQEAIVKRLPTPVPTPTPLPPPTAAPLPTGGAARPPATPVQAARTFTVTIEDYKFVPEKLVVPVGSTVVWLNKEGDSHNVLSDAKPPPIESPILYFGMSFAATFDKPGTYAYSCTLHDFMHGSIVVE